MKVRNVLFFIVFMFCSICTNAQNSSHSVAIARAKAVFIASANGDVAKLKQLMTPDFYKKNFPYSDSRIRQILLDVPKEKRMKLINDIQNNCTVSTIMSSSGDVITVIFTNKNTNKDIRVQLFDEYLDGDWKIFNYAYY